MLFTECFNNLLSLHLKCICLYVFTICFFFLFLKRSVWNVSWSLFLQFLMVPQISQKRHTSFSIQDILIWCSQSDLSCNIVIPNYIFTPVWYSVFTLVIPVLLLVGNYVAQWGNFLLCKITLFLNFLNLYLY